MRLRGYKKAIGCIQGHNFFEAAKRRISQLDKVDPTILDAPEKTSMQFFWGLWMREAKCSKDSQTEERKEFFIGPAKVHEALLAKPGRETDGVLQVHLASTFVELTIERTLV